MTNMTGQDKKISTSPKEKSLAEKYLEEKRNAILGLTQSNQFGNKNPMAGRSGFGGKTGGGKPTIRKHAARSR